MSAVAPQPVSRLTGTTGVSGATTQTDLVVSDRLTKVIIKRVKLKRTAGTAANLTPRIFKVSGAANGSIDQEFVGTATAVADLFDVVAEVYVFTDKNGKLYLQPSPDAGADNVFQYEVYFDIVR